MTKAPQLGNISLPDSRSGRRFGEISMLKLYGSEARRAILA
jgi:hypothetical protein